MSSIKPAKSIAMIGTSGYYYDDWRKVFYPPDLPKNKMLEYYTDHFDIVEINVTYYKIPEAKTFESMVSRTPDDLTDNAFCFTLITNYEDNSIPPAGNLPGDSTTNSAGSASNKSSFSMIRHNTSIE